MDYPFPSRKSVVHSTKGIAASTQPLASAVGIKILDKGGNAADAAVAMAAAMGVTEPMMTGIGGDTFCLWYDASDGSVSGFNGSGKSSRNFDADAIRKLYPDREYLPLHSGLAVNAPGAPAAWVDILEKWGTLPLNSVLEPAIELADKGFPVSAICSSMWKNSSSSLRKVSPHTCADLLPTGKAPSEGDLFVNPKLAETYRTLAREGKKGFYEGRIADAIVSAVSEHGGALDHEDLRSHSNLFLKPLSIAVNDQITLHELPPNNHGIVALIAIGIINTLQKQGRIDLTKMDHNSPEYLHLIVEALKFAFKDAEYYIGDPHESKDDLTSLLTDDYLESRAALFNPDKVNNDYEHGEIIPASAASDTAYFCVSDSEGNSCSIIASLYHSFGSCIIPSNVGFALHNRGCNFTLKKGARNSIGPSKRPYHTIIPAMLTSGRDLYANYGVMGGFMQPQGHVQVALNLCSFGMNPQVALDAPRICISPLTDNGGMPSNGIVVNLEEGVSSQTRDKLESLGHKVNIVRGPLRSLFGRGQVILRSISDNGLPDAWHAGSDLRGDGAAIPQV